MAQKDPPLEMINNSLTVKIEKDLYDTTGKAAPKYVNRLGSQNSPTRLST